MQTLGEIRHKNLLVVTALTGNSARTGRLAALGFLPGRRIRISHVAPLGDPISIEMQGQEISLRRTEANLIQVEEIA